MSEENVEILKSTFSDIRLRLHANARVFPQHQLWDASSFSQETKLYFETLAKRSKQLNAPAYSLHAGFRTNATLHQMFDNVRAIQDLFQDIPVALEGLYPNKKMPQLVDSWKEYEALLESDLYMAIDMSHLNIVAKKEGWCDDLVKALLSSSKCLEVHVSVNDGRADQHQVAQIAPTWLPYLEVAHENAMFFSEGDQYRFERTQLNHKKHTI